MPIPRPWWHGFADATDQAYFGVGGDGTSLCK